MSEALAAPKRRYTEEEVRRGLLEVATCMGGLSEAARNLRDQGHTVPVATLGRWKKMHADDYEEIRREVVPRIHERLAYEREQLAKEQARVELKALARLEEELGNIPARDLAGAMRNLSTSSAINIDKALLLRGKPTEIRQTTSADPAALFAKLQQAFPGALSVEGTAVEEPEELPSPAES